MKLRKLALVATIACGTYAGNLFADQTNDISLVSHCAAPACDCCEPVCGCEPCCEEDPCCDTTCCESDCCDSGCDSCGCDSGGCGLLSGMGMGQLGSCLPGCDNCCLGDPYTLCDDDICGFTVGGWLSMGYHSRANTLFNSYQDNFQLHQAWLYLERGIDTECGFDIGGRFDIMYGTDSQDTQAFGTDPRGWDNDWDNGGNYGAAAPQLYLEAGYGDLSMVAGHFYTIIGYEVVTAPDNFFYSHAYTFFNSEPFTHTGFLGKYTPMDEVTVWGGYTFGWDSGFDDNGDSFLGGISVDLTDKLTLIYATIGGRFGEARFNGVEKGYMHSIVADYAVTDSLQYVFQSDLLDTEDATNTTVRETIGVNNYLIKTINDCWALGTRFEWYQNEGVYTDVGDTADIFAWTIGVNYRPHANVIFRPEIRWDWVSDNDEVLAAGNTVTQDGDDDQFAFGFDSILTF